MKKDGFLYPGPRRELTITRRGKASVHQWILNDEIVTVWGCSAAPRSAHVGGMRPEGLARQLLNELIDGAEVKTN